VPRDGEYVLSIHDALYRGYQRENATELLAGKKDGRRREKMRPGARNVIAQAG
jgi:hypothetical protein